MVKDGFQFAKNLGFPIILKPNNKSMGSLVTKVYNRAEYFPVANKILKQWSVMLVERFYPGQDYRIVVLDNEVISVYKRIPLSITENGTSTVSDLIKAKQEYFQATGRDTIIDYGDFRITAKLSRQNYLLSSVIPEEERVCLLDNSSLSTGGDAVDYTNETHADYKNLAVRVTKDMGLRMCGIDVLIDSEISRSLKDYIILEINSSSGLDNYVSIGKEQQLIVENLY